LHGAFASAVENLAADPGLVKLAVSTTRAARPTAATTESITVFRPVKLRKEKIEQEINSLLSAVVTIRAGGGHGSGFAISQDGLIMTNQHVVGDVQEVGVILSNGVEVTGTVVKRDSHRDVALVRVPIRVPEALAIRLTPVRRLERVFAIGSPIREDLRSTVTSGIVSAVRQHPVSGLDFIQSDAAVSKGNSGGPLVDENGNVVGIAVLKVRGPTAENLNLFIPIEAALDALALKAAE
jgi:S1-C subfamily serine protease